jgi:serine/threonine protein phosphatase PrpC
MFKNLLLELSSKSSQPTNLKSWDFDPKRTEAERVRGRAPTGGGPVRPETVPSTERTGMSLATESRHSEGSRLLQFLQCNPNRVGLSRKWDQSPAKRTELIDVDSSDCSDLGFEKSSSESSESQKHTENQTEICTYSYEKLEVETTMLTKREPANWMSDQPLRLIIGAQEQAERSAEKTEQNGSRAEESEESESEESPAPAEVAKGYAANSDRGDYRSYNEDRIVVVLNVPKPVHFVSEYWPKCSYYAIFDGHGGSNCAEFLKNHLHRYILKHESFPSDVEQAIQKGFETAETEFCKDAVADSEEIDLSGSCALVIILVEDICYLANLGDSRAVGSFNFGDIVRPLTVDHKPNLESERSRILRAGGRVYQSNTKTSRNAAASIERDMGMLRVNPGGLNVSRTIGDIEAKLPKLGGKPGVISALPELKTLKVAKELDFILMGSDGIFDKMENDELVKTCWKAIEDYKNEPLTDLRAVCLKAVEDVMIRCLAKKTLDNISLILISFKSLKQLRDRHHYIEQENLTLKNLRRFVDGSSWKTQTEQRLLQGSEGGGPGCSMELLNYRKVA